MSIRLSAQEHFFEGRDLVEKFASAQAAGFDGIELLGAGDGRFAARADELRRARDAGVVMPTVYVQMDHFIGDFDAERRRDARAQMKLLLSTIVEAGGFGAITPASWGMFSTRLPPFTPPRDAEGDREVLLEELTALGEHAREVGATLLLEPLNRYEDHMVNSLAQAVDLIRAVDLPSVRVVGDFFHMSIEEVDLDASMRQAAPYLAHFQVSDTNRLEPGAGHPDWERLSGPAAEVLPHVSKLLRR
jgi:sugar phosphate isomerase/epimerase